jgi:hypothetical protein
MPIIRAIAWPNLLRNPCCRSGSSSVAVWILSLLLCIGPAVVAEEEPGFSAEGGSLETVESTESPEAESPWEFGLELDFLSQYAFRGFLLTEGPVMQPYVHVSYSRLTLGVFANMNLDERDWNPGRFDEFDFDVFWTQEIGNLTLAPGFTYYYYPLEDYDPDTGEVFLLLAHPVGPVDLEFLNTVDVVTYSGYWYSRLSVRYEWAITDRVILEAGLSVDYSTDPNEDEDEYSTVFPELAVSCYFTDNAYVRPHVSFSHFLCSSFVPEDDDILIWGMAVGLNF